LGKRRRSEENELSCLHEREWNAEEKNGAPEKPKLFGEEEESRSDGAFAHRWKRLNGGHSDE